MKFLDEQTDQDAANTQTQIHSTGVPHFTFWAANHLTACLLQLTFTVLGRVCDSDSIQNARGFNHPRGLDSWEVAGQQFVFLNQESHRF